MSVDTSFENRSSPSAQSMSQMSNTSGYYHDPRRPILTPRTWSLSILNMHLHPSHVPPPALDRIPPALPQVHSLFYQRSLPQASPTPMPMPVNSSNTWQHYHYPNPSKGPSDPQSKNHICQTCNKAFRGKPRVHRRSKECKKPFKCPNAGCGKAYGFHSSMRRHERGCRYKP